MSSIENLLPPSLMLPQHLSAHRYLFVCSLTIAAWDLLVLSARTWQTMRSPGWPLLKVTLLAMPYILPVQLVATGVAFFNPDFSRSACERFYLFDPIITAILTSLASLSLLYRASAIHSHKRTVSIPFACLFFVQVVVQAACCAFYQVVPLQEQQGCVAGPKHAWVGIYWVFPTLTYGACFTLALARSFEAQRAQPIGLWKLMLRDGLNLYGTIFGVNLINVLFWFIAKPTDASDTIRTIVTSMATVLTTTTTMRVILLIRGSLTSGGSFVGSGSPPSGFSSHSHSPSYSKHPSRLRNSTVSQKHATPGPVYDPARSAGAPTYAIDIGASTNLAKNGGVNGPRRPGFEFLDSEEDSKRVQGLGRLTPLSDDTKDGMHDRI